MFAVLGFSSLNRMVVNIAFLSSTERDSRVLIADHLPSIEYDHRIRYYMRARLTEIWRGLFSSLISPDSPYFQLETRAVTFLPEVGLTKCLGLSFDHNS